jgi:hypothetical protein
MTSARLEAADGLARAEFAALGLLDEYAEYAGMVTRCLAIRNRYGHCNWGDDGAAGLFLTDMQDAVAAHEGFHFDRSWRHVDCDLLEWQYAYFSFTMDWNRFLEEQLQIKRGVTGLAPILPMPPRSIPPPAHNAPEKHTPPWLPEDRRAEYEEHTRAIAEGRPAPTPAQQAKEARRAEKQAKKEADRQRDLAKKLPK